MARGKKTGGRKAGTLNKVTAEVKTLAMQYGPNVLKELARLSIKAESEQARVAACREILDRAYGKAPQPLEHSGQLDASARPIVIMIRTRTDEVPSVSIGENGDRPVLQDS